MFKTTLKHTISGNLTHVTCRKLPHLGCYTVFLHQGFLSNQTIHVHVHAWKILKMAKKAIYEILCTKLEAFNLIDQFKIALTCEITFSSETSIWVNIWIPFHALKLTELSPLFIRNGSRILIYLKSIHCFSILYWEKHLDCSFISSNKYGKEI